MTQEALNSFFAGLKFRKKLFGGVDEWQVLKEVERSYEAYQLRQKEQEFYYQALLKAKEHLLLDLENLATRRGQVPLKQTFVPKKEIKRTEDLQLARKEGAYSLLSLKKIAASSFLDQKIMPLRKEQI